jgi:2-haloacid dehalogenase
VPHRWATFDCYGTLIDWERGVRDAFARQWPNADVERALRRFHAIEPLVQEEGGLPYREVLARALCAVAAIEGLTLRAGAEGALAESLPDWPPFPEAPAALAGLREGAWKLAILSNTDPDLLEASVAAIGVEIDLAITATEAGSYKPAHGHWERFFERASADRRRHVHVAASLFHDIAPAAELGLTCVWINRKHEESMLPRAEELADLARLPETLGRLIPKEVRSVRC